MTATLCALATCRIPRRHQPTCRGDCTGCLPAPAADGLRLCVLHATHIGRDAAQVAELYDELALRLIGGNNQGEPVTGSPTSRTPSPAAINARHDIQTTLALLVQLLVEERGFTHLGYDSVHTMATFVADSHPWLAAHKQAAIIAESLADLRRRAWGVAYPSGTHTVHVGPCPEVGCSGTLVAVVRAADAQLPSEVVCDAEPAHRWDSTRWRQLDRLVSARKAAA